jgi:hypothetical protein
VKVITEGHKYELENHEARFTPGQIIQFIEKTPTGENGALVTVNDGTTNEEVLKVLINRLTVLGFRVPSRETSTAITKLEEALMWLEKRTANRVSRGVEGTAKA